MDTDVRSGKRPKRSEFGYSSLGGVTIAGALPLLSPLPLPQGYQRHVIRAVSQLPPNRRKPQQRPPSAGLPFSAGPSADASGTNKRARWNRDTLLGQLTRLTGNRRVGGRHHCARDRGEMCADVGYRRLTARRGHLQRQKRNAMDGHWRPLVQ